MTEDVLSPDDLAQLSPEQIELLSRQVDSALLQQRAVLARLMDNPDSFGHFFWCITGNELPPFALETWVPELYKGLQGSEHNETGAIGVMIKGFRGSTKSTIMMCWAAYRTGKRPVGNTMVVQKSDTAGARTAKAVATIIEFSQGWKLTFPNVVPDKDRGWGESGYYVKDTSQDYNEFVSATVKDHTKEPSFIGVGIGSGLIIGSHPTNGLYIDDIHDLDNTRSPAEMQTVKQQVQANLLPVFSRPGPKPFIGVAYTPWADDDAYVDMEITDLFRRIETPIFKYDENGADEWDGRNVTLAWPKEYGIEQIKVLKRLYSTEFARMCLLDLKVDRTASLKYYTFDENAIDWQWVVVGGADTTNVIRTKQEGAKRSHFALAYVAKIPQGGAVVVDGVLVECSQLEAESFITQAQTKFMNYLHTAIENVGGGALFIQVARRNPDLRIIDSDLSGFLKKGGKIRSKQDRFAMEAAPWFERGTVRISSANTPFLNALRRLFTNFYRLDPHSAPEYDAGDAVYHALKSIPDVLTIGSLGNGELPSVYRHKQPHPFNAFGRK